MSGEDKRTEEDKRTDPIERIIQEALDAVEIRHVRPRVDLDFYLTDYDIFIECKQFPPTREAERVKAQLHRAENIISIQGRRSALFFTCLLKASYGRLT